MCICLLLLPAFLYGGQSGSLLWFAEVPHCQQCSGRQSKPCPAEREKREETHWEKDQLAQQLSRALRCCLPLPPSLHRNTHRCLLAVSLPFTHKHSPFRLSHTGSPTWWSALITEECHQARGQRCCTGSFQCIHSSWLSSSGPPSLTCLPHPNNNTQTGSSKRDLQLDYQRPKAQSESAYAREREREREEKRDSWQEWIWANKDLNGEKESKDHGLFKDHVLIHLCIISILVLIRFTN